MVSRQATLSGFKTPKGFNRMEKNKRNDKYSRAFQKI